MNGLPHRGAAGEQRGVALPAFSRFTPAHRRPGLDLLEERCRSWSANALRKAHRDDPAGFERFLDQRTGLWTLLTYATSRPDRVEPICHWIDVLFDLDDLFAHADPRRVRDLGLHDLPAVVEGRTPTTGTPHVRALASLRQHFAAEMPAALWSRFQRTMTGFLDACRTERRRRDAGTTVTLTDYRRTRHRSIGECCFPLLEHGLGLDLTRELVGFPALRRLNALVARHWIDVNDLFSYRKEVGSGDTTNQIVLLLTEGHDLRSAVDRVVEEVDRVEEEFLVLRRRLLTGPAGRHPGTATYADALGWMIAGNLEWSCITTRYHGDGHTWNGEYTTVVGPAPQHRPPNRTAPASW